MVLYINIIEPIGYKAKERNAEFEIEYAKVQNRFTKEFISTFCSDDGQVLWEKIVQHNSGKTVPKPKKR